MRFFSCTACEVRDKLLNQLYAERGRACPSCENLRLQIIFLEVQLSKVQDSLLSERKEYKRAIDRLLEQKSIAPVAQQDVAGAGVDSQQLESLMSVFEERSP